VPSALRTNCSQSLNVNTTTNQIICLEDGFGTNVTGPYLEHNPVYVTMNGQGFYNTTNTTLPVCASLGYVNFEFSLEGQHNSTAQLSFVPSVRGISSVNCSIFLLCEMNYIPFYDYCINGGKRFI
jgi:hypothetical protein